jgi:hypothetical protein
VDDPLLVRVLNGVADLHDKLQPLAGRELMLIAILRDPRSAYQLHDKVGPTQLGGACIENLRDVRMVHHRERLSFRFEAGDHAGGVHAGLDQLDGDVPSHRFRLLSQVDHTATTLPDFLPELVATQRDHHRFVHRRICPHTGRRT